MDAINLTIDNPVDLIRSLNVADLRDRLKRAEAEADALRVLLRSARARERHQATSDRQEMAVSR